MQPAIPYIESHVAESQFEFETPGLEASETPGLEAS